jgi:hypothetical protein
MSRTGDDWRAAVAYARALWMNDTPGAEAIRRGLREPEVLAPLLASMVAGYVEVLSGLRPGDSSDAVWARLVELGEHHDHG